MSAKLIVLGAAVRLLTGMVVCGISILVLALLSGFWIETKGVILLILGMVLIIKGLDMISGLWTLEG